MQAVKAIAALAALAHGHRLQAYRVLVERGPAGMAAGRLAERMRMPPSSLSFHLQALQRAGLVTRRRDGRQLFYAADFDVMGRLVGYLTENCCGGAVCVPSCAPPVRAQAAAGRARSAA